MPCSCGSSECNCQERCRCRYSHCLCVPCYIIQGNRCHLCSLPAFHRSSPSPDGWCNCFISESQVILNDSQNLNGAVDVNQHRSHGDTLVKDIDQPLPTASLEVQRKFFEQGTYYDPQISEPNELSSSLEVLALEDQTNTDSHLDDKYLPIIPLEQTEVVTHIPPSDILSLPTDRVEQTQNKSYESSMLCHQSDVGAPYNAATYNIPTRSYNQNASEITGMTKSFNKTVGRHKARNENKIGRSVENTGKGIRYSKPSYYWRNNSRVFINSYYKNRNTRLLNNTTSERLNISARPTIPQPTYSNHYGPVNYIPYTRPPPFRPETSSFAIVTPPFHQNNVYHSRFSARNMQANIFTGSRFQNISNVQPALNPRIIRNASWWSVHPPPPVYQSPTVRSNILNWMNNSNSNTCLPNSTGEFSGYSTFTNEPNTSERALLIPEASMYSHKHCGNAASGYRSSQYQNATVTLEHDEKSVTTLTSSSGSLTIGLDTDESDSIKASSNKSFRTKLGLYTENNLSPTTELLKNTSEDGPEKETIPSEESTSVAIDAEVESTFEAKASHSSNAGGSELLQNTNTVPSSTCVNGSPDNKFEASKLLENLKTSCNETENSVSSNIRVTASSTSASSPRDELECTKVLEDMKTTASLTHVSDPSDEFKGFEQTESLKTTHSGSRDEPDSSKELEDMKVIASLTHVSDPPDELEGFKLTESVMTTASGSQNEPDRSKELEDMKAIASLTHVSDPSDDLEDFKLTESVKTAASGLRDEHGSSKLPEDLKTTASLTHVSVISDELESCKLLENVKTAVFSARDSDSPEDKSEGCKLFENKKTTVPGKVKHFKRGRTV